MIQQREGCNSREDRTVARLPMATCLAMRGHKKGEQQMRILPKPMRSLLWLGMLLSSVLVVASVAPALEVGDKAPDFTRPSTTGEKTSLSQFQGKKNVLIEFYVRDFGPTCIQNLSANGPDSQEFQDL